MDRGHWTAPPGVEKLIKLPKWTFGRLDENSETPETEGDTGRPGETDIWTEDTGQRPLVLKNSENCQNGRLDGWTKILRLQRQRETRRDRYMDRGHWTAPPGVEKFRKLPKWTFGRLDEDFESSETQGHTGETERQTKDTGQRQLVAKYSENNKS